jgi:hypothetical protein
MLVTFHALFKDIREISYFILINIQQIKEVFETEVIGLHKHKYCHLYE